ncbi:MAG: hypothetical protein RIR94_667 [Bacteroidota bacterium]|jgi:hypothetical protein
MKKTLTLLFLLISCCIQAQNCTIDFTQNQVGIYPNALPNGTVGQIYNQDITFVMPTDTLGYDFTNFHIISVGLPVGLNWACNNSAANCNYNPQTSPFGCVNIHGTPLLAGSYTIDITVLADLTFLTGYPFVFQQTLEILPAPNGFTNNGFSCSGAPACAPALVSFTNNNPGLLQYTWDFGNGNFSNQENPSAQYYPNPGTYVVSYYAYPSLDTTTIFSLQNIQISAMSNYGGGFPSYDSADSYFKIIQNGAVVYQSTINGDQNPPVQWTFNFNLNNNQTYILEIWEADQSNLESYFGNDDFIGSHPLQLYGCNGCVAGNAIINYDIGTQQILPTPQLTSIDTIIIYELPLAPDISYDSLTHTLSTTGLGFSYQWYFNGSPIAGANSTTHTIYQSGDYALVAINSNNCIAFSAVLNAVYCDPFLQPIISENNGALLVSNIAQDVTISWLFNGNTVANQQDNTFITSENGSYQCIVTDAFGCSDTTNILLIDLSLSTNTLEQPTIYPNPAKDIVSISLPTHWMESLIELIDLNGKVLFSEKASEKEHAIHFTSLESGFYLLRLSNQTTQFQHWIFILPSH